MPRLSNLNLCQYRGSDDACSRVKEFVCWQGLDLSQTGGDDFKVE